MIIAGFDLATRSGAAVFDGDRLVHAEAFRPKGDTDGAIFRGFRVWFRALLVSHGVEHVGIEQPLVTNIEVQDKRDGRRPGDKRNPITMSTYLRLYGIRGHAIEICEALNIPCDEIHQASWRKSFIGSGRADKDAAVQRCKLLGYPITSKDACEAVGVAWHLRGMLNPAMRSLFDGVAA